MFHYFKIPYFTCTFFTKFIYNEYIGPYSFASDLPEIKDLQILMWHKFDIHSVETSNCHDTMEVSHVLLRIFSNHLVFNLDQFLEFPPVSSSLHLDQV